MYQVGKWKLYDIYDDDDKKIIHCRKHGNNHEIVFTFLYMPNHVY